LGGSFRVIATSRTTGALSTTIGVLLRKAEAAPQTAISSQMPIPPTRRHKATILWIAVSSRPDNSIA
jgi:hypothetical protein